MEVDPIKYAKNRAYQFVEEQQQALDEGKITEAQWFDNYNQFFTANYLAADNPGAQSGHGGDEAGYRYTWMMILEAIHKSGTFLDVGCANGYLMESLHKWLEGSGLKVEFYGLDFSERLLELAKRRFLIGRIGFSLVTPYTGLLKTSMILFTSPGRNMYHWDGRRSS